MAQKSLTSTYLLWLFFGFFGLHHIYLGRDRHALLMCFFGGFFGIGWLHDLWRIPGYVREANEDSDYLQLLADKMQQHEKPPNCLYWVCVQIVVGDVFGRLADASLHEVYMSGWLQFAVVPFAIAVGVHLVGNIDREGPFKPPLYGAYVAYACYMYACSCGYFYFSGISVFSTLCFSFSRQWRRTPQSSKQTSKRIVVLLLCGFLYASLWWSWFNFNCTVTSQDGKKIKCFDIAWSILTEPTAFKFDNPKTSTS